MFAHARSKLPILKWIAILPEVGELVGEIVSALADGRVDEAEVKAIGAKAVAIVAAVL